MSEFLQAALAYAARGWSVIPLRPRDKRPLLDSWSPYQQQRATADQLQAWWTQWPDANVGLVAGAISGLVILDVDGPEGTKSLLTLTRVCPKTCVSSTGKGKHLLFRHPGGSVRNFARKLPGLDLRGDGGYIVAPPSIHPNGKTYKWIMEHDIAEVPDWLLGIISGDKQPQQKTGRVDPEWVFAGIPEGQRDNELYKYACYLRAKALSRPEAEKLILEAAKSCRPPFEPDDAITKLNSAWKHPEGTERDQAQNRAREIVDKIETIESAFDQETIGALATLKENDPSTYAKAKQRLKSELKVNLNDLERAINTERASRRNIHVVQSTDEPAPLLRDIIPDSPLPDLRIPFNWILSRAGIGQDTPKGPIVACTVPIILTKRLRSVDTGQERVGLAFLRDGQWQHIIADRLTVFNQSTVVQLTNKGLPVTSVNARDLVRYLHDLERENMATLPLERSTQHLGWVNSTTFIPGAQEGIALDLDEGSEYIASCYREEGSLSQWVELVTPLRNYPLGRMMLAAGFAAPLLELINQRVFLLHLWGPSRSGKSAALKAALSVWGEPEGVMTSFNSTKVGLEKMAALYSDLPLGIDERQVVGDKQDFIESLVYVLGMGKGKARGSKGGGLQRFSMWRTIALTNGEHPLTNHSSPTGVTTRVLEMYGNAVPDESYAGKLHRDLGRTFGVAGPTFIRYIMQIEPTKIRHAYEGVLKELQAQFPDRASSHLSYVATLTIADCWASHIIWGLGIAEAATQSMRMAAQVLQQLDSTAEMSESVRAFDYIRSWYMVNQLHFGANPPAGKSYGCEETEWVYISPIIFHTAMQEGGFNAERILRDWADSDLIKTEVRGGKRRFRVRRYVSFMGQVYFIAVRMSPAECFAEPVGDSPI